MWKVTVRTLHNHVSVLVSPNYGVLATGCVLAEKCESTPLSGIDVGRALLNVYDLFCPTKLSLGVHKVRFAGQTIGEVEITKENIMKKQKVTRVSIYACSGSRFDFKVCNDAMEFGFCQQIIITSLKETKDPERRAQLEDILRVYNEWGGSDWSPAHHAISVAGSCIGSVNLFCEEVYWCLSKVLPQVKKYKATLQLASKPWLWENIIDVRRDHNPNVIMREAIKHSRMKCIPEEAAKWLKSAAVHIPCRELCGHVMFAGVRIGSFKIEEYHGS